LQTPFKSLWIPAAAGMSADQKLFRIPVFREVPGVQKLYFCMDMQLCSGMQNTVSALLRKISNLLNAKNM